MEDGQESLAWEKGGEKCCIEGGRGWEIDLEGI